MYTTSLLSKNLPPLAERIRPQILSDFTGQKKIVKSKGLLYQAIKSKQPFSIIFWGPPGSGKTTLARIISRNFSEDYYQLSAISSGVKDIRNILQKGKSNFDIGKRTILFIDEIHRFTKSQQDALLHAVEEGIIILIGATTENPSFEIILPLLSRCRIMKLTSLNNQELTEILFRAIKEDILIGPKNLASTVSQDSSRLFSKNVVNFLMNSCESGKFKSFNWDDEVVKETCVIRNLNNPKKRGS